MSMILNYILGGLMLMLSFMLLLKFYNHALMILLCIEFIVLINLLNLYMILVNYFKDYFLLLYMVVFVVEGILGISLVVMMIRFKGNEYYKNLNLLMW
uniref:NADH dehydrogenase subunit 4L n=1 Tax=Dolichovespula panda TaxID=2040468 RepID=A0A291C4Z6_9HYME|nr:NADH dehydrogenase subunit 4L [Dolichovespula panda]ATF28548.1 NADH dehydrogenase subunit 4L [Dolichovespula panda]